jgi:hypothetical protein
MTLYVINIQLFIKYFRKFISDKQVKLSFLALPGASIFVPSEKGHPKPALLITDLIPGF